MLEHVVKRALQTPWAITPEYGAIVLDVLMSRVNGIRLSDEDIRARIDAQRLALPERAELKAFFMDEDDEEQHDPTHYAVIPLEASAGASRGADGVIAVIPIHGVIANRSFEASSGMTSAEMISAMFVRAENDPAVKAILFDVSSPGGSVSGVPELAKLIASGEKARVAFVNALSASAAYWLSAQAHEIVARETAMVGSVGVYALLEDWSAKLEKEGIKINAISAGDYKLEGAPWQPLADESRAHFQAQVDETYGKFLNALATGRSTNTADVKKNYGQGRVLTSDKALNAGMIDRIGELPVAIARANTLARSHKSTQSASAPVKLAAGEAVLNAEQQAQLASGPTVIVPHNIVEDAVDDAVKNQAAADRDALELARARD
jgi:signal peptide peptidase SppA